MWTLRVRVRMCVVLAMISGLSRVTSESRGCKPNSIFEARGCYFSNNRAEYIFVSRNIFHVEWVSHWLGVPERGQSTVKVVRRNLSINTHLVWQVVHVPNWSRK